MTDTPDTPREVIEKIAKLAHAISWQAGVGGRETAGAIVSYLVMHPEKIDAFMVGDISPLDFDPGEFMTGGCLSWHAADGTVWTPEQARDAAARKAGEA